MTLLIYLSGYLALTVVLFNSASYWLFLWIRKSRNRKRVIRLARLARLWMKIHRPAAAAALGFVLLHAGAVLFNYGILMDNPVILTGLTAGVVFSVLLISGLIRNRKATGRRKKAHRLMSFIFLIILAGHLFTSWFL